MRSGRRAAIVGGVCAVVIGAAGYGVYGLLADSDDGSNSSASDGKRGDGTDLKAKSVKTGPLEPAEVRTVSHQFLAAWSAGDAAKAASFTDDREAAATALTGYRKDAHVAKASLTSRAATGAQVPFTVDADISYGKQHVPWTYQSKLTVTRDTTTGRALVDWKPSVVYPKLGAGDKLKTGAADAPPIKAVDRNGTELDPAAHPTLKAVLAALRERYGKSAGGTAGVETWIDRAKGADGKDRPDETLKVLSKGKPGTLHTTLDTGLQTAAEQAIAKQSKASVVAIKPSTGEILAVANAPADGFNAAFQGSYAPGSTMKVVTSALLIDKGLAGYGKPHPCPKNVTYGGWKFHNDDNFEIQGGTFEQSFARSCNTAFISQASKLSDDALTQEARDVFGLGLNWQAGITTLDGVVPVQHDAPKAASLIGQGGVRMNPLNMASVAATATTGTFHQPFIVAPSLDHRTLAKAPRAMAASTSQQLRQLMRLTATSGTAAQAMAGISGDIGAKTGSAEVDGQDAPNGWFTAYRDDLAAAAVVPQGGHGGDSAGPIVASVLKAG